MADQTVGGSGFPIKFHDNGDGTYAPYTALVSGSIDVGAVNVEGYYSSSLPTLSNGTYSALQIDSSGRLITAPFTGATQSIAVNDGSNTANVVAGDTGFNGIATAGATELYIYDHYYRRFNHSG